MAKQSYAQALVDAIYDSLAADTLLGHSGFVGGFLTEGFHGNQNVFANRVGIE